MKKLEEIKSAKELIKELEKRGYIIKKTKIKGRYQIGTKIVRFRYDKDFKQMKLQIYIYSVYRSYSKPKEVWFNFYHDEDILRQLGKPYKI